MRFGPASLRSAGLCEGHTFGLPHPGDCVGVAPAQCVYGALDHSASVVGGALMQFGYLTYSSTYLLPEEKAFLRVLNFLSMS
jgi:hypothetical protein